jgi:hypothetical protein
MTLWDQAKEETGFVFFFEGIFCGSGGDLSPIVWAESPIGKRRRTNNVIASLEDSEDVITIGPALEVATTLLCIYW